MPYHHPGCLPSLHAFNIRACMLTPPHKTCWCFSQIANACGQCTADAAEANRRISRFNDLRVSQFYQNTTPEQDELNALELWNTLPQTIEDWAADARRKEEDTALMLWHLLEARLDAIRHEEELCRAERARHERARREQALREQALREQEARRAEEDYALQLWHTLPEREENWRFAAALREQIRLAEEARYEQTRLAEEARREQARLEQEARREQARLEEEARLAEEDANAALWDALPALEAGWRAQDNEIEHKAMRLEALEEEIRRWQELDEAYSLDQARRAQEARDAEYARRLATVPSTFFCPITGEIMKDPVVNMCGNTYERLAITEWYKRSYKDPLFGQNVNNMHLFPNRALKELIEDYFSRNMPVP